MTDACLVGGFVLFVLGVYLTFGVGWTCMVAGVVVFAAGAREAAKG